jgi:hypothetical protein
MSKPHIATMTHATVATSQIRPVAIVKWGCMAIVVVCSSAMQYGKGVIIM